MLTPMPSTCVFTTMSTSSASTPALRSADRRGPSRATSSKARNGSTSTTADGVRTIVADDPMRSERSSVTDQGDSHSAAARALRVSSSWESVRSKPGSSTRVISTAPTRHVTAPLLIAAAYDRDRAPARRSAGAARGGEGVARTGRSDAADHRRAHVQAGGHGATVAQHGLRLDGEGREGRERAEEPGAERHRHDVRPSPKVTGAQQEAESEGSDEVDAERRPREVPRCERRAEAVASQGAGGSCDREQRDLHWGRAQQRMATLCPLRQYEAAITGVAD